MSMMPLETLDKLKEIYAVRILEVKCDGHYTVFLQSSINGINMRDILCILKIICSDSRDFRFYVTLV